MTMQPDRLQQLNARVVASGAHKASDGEACTMELVAWLANEPWGDKPSCASPRCTGFAISLNDAISDDGYRTQLMRPLVPLLVGSRTAAADELTRSYIALDWLVRVYVPTWLDLVPALKPRAAQLRDIAPITGPETFGPAVRTLLEGVRKGSAAARDAAGAAAWDAAWAAAWAAAWDAAGAAAGDALAPTVRELQASAAITLKRMCEVGRG